MKTRLFRTPLLVLLVVGALQWFAPANIALANTNADVASALSSQDVYISPSLSSGHVGPGDQQRLQNQVNDASKKQVAEKLALITTYPSNYRNLQDAATGLQNFLDYSGVLVIVTPKGIGVSSDLLSTKSNAAIAKRAAPSCARSYTDCAVLAGKLAVTKVRRAENNAFSGALKFLLFSLVGLALLIGVLAFAFFRRRSVDRGPLTADASAP